MDISNIEEEKIMDIKLMFREVEAVIIHLESLDVCLLQYQNMSR